MAVTSVATEAEPMGNELTVLAAIAGASGLFNAAQASLAGVTSDAIRRHVATRRLIRVAKGWYAVGPIANAEDRHMLAARALVATFAGRAVASHQTAVLWHGLPLYLWMAATVHLTRTRDDLARSRKGLVLHGCPGLWDAPCEVVSPALAVVQYGQLMGRESALVAGDALLRTRLGTTDELVAAVELCARHPGNAASRAVLDLLDEKSESVGESRLRLALRTLGFAVTSQVLIQQARARVDFLLDDVMVVIEFDGRVKYGEGDAVFQEKLREDRLRDLGYEVVRFVWSELGDLNLIRDRIERAIKRAKARRIPA